MTAVAEFLTGRPSVLFRKNSTFYFRYDLTYLVLCSVALLAMISTGMRPIFGEWTWWLPVLLPVACYAVMCGHVFAHNAAHGNFPKPVNRLMGEIAGLVVLSRFASWEIIHMRHHQYSDDLDRDPHPNMGGYWKTFFHTLVNVEKQLQQNFLDLHGDTAENRKREKTRALISYATNIVLIACWFRLLGAPGFLLLFVPASIAATLHLIHFNWSTHNGMKGSDFKPVDIDQGIFWFGNRIFFGIYYHDTHHRNTKLFNPMLGALGKIN